MRRFLAVVTALLSLAVPSAGVAVAVTRSAAVGPVVPAVEAVVPCGDRLLTTPCAVVVALP